LSKSFFSGPPSDHFDGQRFFNPWSPMPPHRSRDVWKWHREGGRQPWPDKVSNPPRQDRPAPMAGMIRTTFIGHATMLVEMDGMTILLDPVFSARVSPFSFAGPKRIRSPFLSLKELPKIDAIFISHNHYDHMDVASLDWLVKHHHPVLVTPLGNSRHLPAGNRPVVELDWYQSHWFDKGITLTLTPSQHWSRRSLSDINRDLWGGCVLTSLNGKRVYFTGDSGFHEGLFAEIGKRFPAPDLAIVPIGAYEPRWFMAYAHMNPAEAVEVCQLVQAKKAMGFHFETVQLTDEAFDAPRNATIEALLEQGLPQDYFLIPHPGDYTDV